MNITIAAVGKIRENYLKQGMDEYKKRLRPYARVNVVEVSDEKAPETLSAAEEEQVKQAEGSKLLRKIPPDAYVIALAIEGNMLDSEGFAKTLGDLAVHGKSKIVFVIGGSLGLSDEVLSRADVKLSFSSMTFPHQLMRLILLEQIYRAFRINRGEPYHK